MKHILITSSLVLLTCLSSCHKSKHCESFNSEVTSETIILEDFDKINLEMEADIIYKQAPIQKVTIEAPKELIPHITTSVFQNNLTIDFKNNQCYFHKKTIKIYIEAPELEKIDIEGSGDFKVENLLQTESLAISISGSGDFYADSLNVESLSVDITGSGDIYAAGTDTLIEQRIKVNGSGDINLINTPSLNTRINISGSSDCKVYAIDNLDIKITGSGDVIYKGTPNIDTDISGSGSVKHF